MRIQWIRWHPRKHVVLAGLEDSTIWMWDANTGDYLTILGHASTVTCGDFTPDVSISSLFPRKIHISSPKEELIY